MRWWGARSFSAGKEREAWKMCRNFLELKASLTKYTKRQCLHTHTEQKRKSLLIKKFSDQELFATVLRFKPFLHLLTTWNIPFLHSRIFRWILKYTAKITEVKRGEQSLVQQLKFASRHLTGLLKESCQPFQVIEQRMNNTYWPKIIKTPLVHASRKFEKRMWK